MEARDHGAVVGVVVSALQLRGVVVDAVAVAS
jgi:hypothetical protein